MTKKNELIVRENVTTNVIGSVAKQPSLRARRSQSRAFAKTGSFFLDCFGLRPRNDVLLLPCVLSPIQTSFSTNSNNKTTSVAGEWTYNQPHYLINIPDNQGNNEVMRLFLLCCHRATEVVLSGKSGGNEVLFPVNKVSSLRDLGKRALSFIRKLKQTVKKQKFCTSKFARFHSVRNSAWANPPDFIRSEILHEQIRPISFMQKFCTSKFDRFHSVRNSARANSTDSVHAEIPAQTSPTDLVHAGILHKIDKPNLFINSVQIHLAFINKMGNFFHHYPYDTD
jgi:hypothetical protein